MYLISQSLLKDTEELVMQGAKKRKKNFLPLQAS